MELLPGSVCVWGGSLHLILCWCPHPICKQSGRLGQTVWQQRQKLQEEGSCTATGKLTSMDQLFAAVVGPICWTVWTNCLADLEFYSLMTVGHSVSLLELCHEFLLKLPSFPHLLLPHFCKKYPSYNDHPFLHKWTREPASASPYLLLNEKIHSTFLFPDISKEWCALLELFAHGPSSPHLHSNKTVSRFSCSSSVRASDPNPKTQCNYHMQNHMQLSKVFYLLSCVFVWTLLVANSQGGGIYPFIIESGAFAGC